MNSKNKADLQRRLSLTPVQKPPADLLDRIKRDIPPHFTMDARQRPSWSLTWNLRAAASLLIVVSAAYIAMHVATLRKADSALPNATPSEVAARNVAQQPPTPVLPPAPARVATGGTNGVTTATLRESAVPAAPRPLAVADRRDEEAPAPAAEGISGSVDGGVAGGMVGGAQETNIASPAAAPPPPPPPAPAPLPEPPPVVAEAAPLAAAAPPMMQISRAKVASSAADTALAAADDSVFGISVDASAFARVKDAIERGERPSAVNVEALVNYFAGAQHTRREVHLEAEGSPAPVPGSSRRAILRYTIDTAAAGEGALAVGTDARLAIELDPAAVASWRRVGGNDEVLRSQDALPKNTSVTALYEIEVKPDVTTRQRVATVRLTYRSAADHREHTLTETVYGRDFARPWRSASRRHRLASLGAVWGETLQGAASGTDVARRAEELAHQEPKDAKARELASLATASSRLQTSAPTGSGR